MRIEGVSGDTGKSERGPEAAGEVSSPSEAANRPLQRILLETAQKRVLARLMGISTPEENPAATFRFGLALSGGGFRASFFHLGVLRRLAEMDLLRHLAVLSAVSGGSLIAAVYALRLKAALERSATLAREDYVSLVAAVERDLRTGVARNLRGRLFSDVVTNVAAFCDGGRATSRRFSRLVYRLLLRDAAAALPSASAGAKQRVPLDDLRVRLPGVEADLEAFNATRADKIPKLVLNSTCLNTGRAFRFTAVEVGDPVLGFLRRDEVDCVFDRKSLLEDRPPAARKSTVFPTTAAHLRWWRGESGGVQTPATAFLDGHPRFSALLKSAEMGTLRRVKIAAWYLRDADGWAGRERRGGLRTAQHWTRIWDGLDDIHPGLGATLRDALGPQAEPERSILELLLDLYYFRSAKAFSWNAGRTLERLTLSDAATASASFPPVLPPFSIHRLYERSVVAEAALTDGGVFDNQGLDALFEEECTHVIASDAGGALEPLVSAPQGRLSLASRVAAVLMDRVRFSELRTLRERRRVTDCCTAMFQRLRVRAPEIQPPAEFADLHRRYALQGVAFFHMLSDPDDGLRAKVLAPHPEARAVAALRTDLDVFCPAEIDALVYQGYQLADRFVRRYLDPPFHWAPPPPEPPVSRPTGDARERAILEAGRFRFFRLLRLSLGWRVAVALLALGAASGLFFLPLTLRSFRSILPQRLARFPLGWILALALLAAAAAALWTTGRRPQRGASTHKRVGARNLLWLVGLLPLWIALLLSLFSSVVRAVDSGPLRRACRRS